MTIRVSDYKNVLYSREYSNDVLPQTNLAKRVALAVVPFLSFHPSLRFPVSIIMGTMRVLKVDTDFFDTVIDSTALIKTIFQHRTGMILTTAQDALIEIKKIQQAKNWEETAKSVIKIFNNFFYLALISRGGLELSVLAFAMQAIINLIQSRDEFKKDRWIEGIAHLLMTGIRFHQFHIQYQQFTRNGKNEAVNQKILIDKLHEKWELPFDQLPTGIEEKDFSDDFSFYFPFIDDLGDGKPKDSNSCEDLTQYVNCY